MGRGDNVTCMTLRAITSYINCCGGNLQGVRCGKKKERYIHTIHSLIYKNRKKKKNRSSTAVSGENKAIDHL